jgi:peptidoglycan/LPS O-acetylase OafA/YrhL
MSKRATGPEAGSLGSMSSGPSPSAAWFTDSTQTLSYVGHDILPLWIDGVEPFFVLSGFLIGGLLIEIAGEGPSFRAWWIFMVRRWMRTLPAYFVVIAVLMVVWPPKYDFVSFVVAYGTLTQNLAWPMPSNQWFGVSWSLTVEEWFYLLFSAIFLSAARMVGRRGQYVVLAAFLLLPILARLAVPANLPWDNWVRKVALLRLDAIAYGVMLARLRADHSALITAWRPTLAVGVVALSAIWLIDSSNVGLGGAVPRSFYLSLSAIGWAFFFPAAFQLAGHGGPISRFIVAVSEQSYIIYLIHLTLLQYCSLLVKNGRLHWLLLVPVALTATWILSYLSLRLFEGPILALRPKQWAMRSMARQPLEVAEIVRAP